MIHNCCMGYTVIFHKFSCTTLLSYCITITHAAYFFFFIMLLASPIYIVWLFVFGCFQKATIAIWANPRPFAFCTYSYTTESPFTRCAQFKVMTDVSSFHVKSLVVTVYFLNLSISGDGIHFNWVVYCQTNK